MIARVLKPVTLTAAIALLVVLAAVAACGGGEPEDLDIAVKVENEKLSPETITVKQNDSVTLKIEAEEPGEFHLHGYDIEKVVSPGEVTDFFFEANITGRFKITFHRLEDDEGQHGESEGHDSDDGEDGEGEHGESQGHDGDDGETEIGILEVRPQ